MTDRTNTLKTKQSEPQATALIIPISEHNIAQLYNCLASPADTVVLLASEKFHDHRSRFAGVLKQLNDKLTIKTMDLPEHADCYSDLCDFANGELTSLSQYYQLELNGTGGTKVIPMALLDCLPIERVYYKGQFDDHLQSWQPGNPESYKKITLPDQISAKHALDLYASKTLLMQSKPNRFSGSADTLAIAEEIWQQYNDINSAMTWLAENLAASPWYDNREKIDSFSLNIPKNRLHDTHWLSWLQKLATFSQGQLQVVNNQLQVQNSQRKKSLAHQFKHWLSGGWLEDLVLSWLSDRIKSAQLLSGVTPSTTGEQGDQRELDFICFHHTAGYVIETKVTHKPGQTANEMVQQLSSLADQFGKLNKVLLLSPLFFSRTKNKQDHEQFSHYCMGHGVKLCHNKDELMALFR